MQPIAPGEEPTGDYPVTPVPFTSVHCNDDFWAPRIETNRTVTIPLAFQKCEQSGRIDLFRRAAASLRGDQSVDTTPSRYPFDDSDVYKIMEGAAYTLSVRPDPGLEAYVDGLVELIAAAQEPDGYLYPARTIDPAHPHPMSGNSRWKRERAHSHELYNLGHLYEAAVAYSQATGKRRLLDISLKSANLLDRTFGPEPHKQSIWPGHQVTELALVKLYRATGNRRYLRLAEFILDSRGPDGSEGSGQEYNQSHIGVAAQSEAVGHAVRATYMYAGMADVAALTGNTRYVTSLDRIWKDVVGKKLYITGGIGADAQAESFGHAYWLPNRTAYAETCASIGNIFWNHRLFLIHGDARYIDLLERTLYNALLAAISLDGMLFFYDNPLESAGKHRRSPWFECACCPSNLARFLPSVPGYVYAQRADTLYINLFVGGTADLALRDGAIVRLAQDTRYPWDGKVRITVNPRTPHLFTVKIRIPGWARSEVVPSDLYRFADGHGDGAPDTPTLTLNGRLVDIQLGRGFVTLEREWRAGDVLELELPMPVRLVEADKMVRADRGKVALQRGPLVYCVELPEIPGERVRDLRLLGLDLHLSILSSLHAEFAPDLLGGVVVIRGRALYRPQTESDFTAIPYYAWANRIPGEMAVWLRYDWPD